MLTQGCTSFALHPTSGDLFAGTPTWASPVFSIRETNLRKVALVGGGGGFSSGGLCVVLYIGFGGGGFGKCIEVYFAFG